MAQFRWLHFSDLHWQTDGHKRYWPEIQEKLFADIIKVGEKCGNSWDAVFFTGDLVNRGNPGEFTGVNTFLDDLKTFLHDNGSDPVFLIVPGNHDLIRPGKNDNGLKLLRLWEEDTDIKDQVLKGKEDSLVWQTIAGAFANYTDWVQNTGIFSKPGKYCQGVLPGDFCATLEKEGNKIGVIGLNTAFLQLEGGDFTGKLDVDPLQLRSLCGENYNRWYKEHTVVIVMTHHPLEWLSVHGKKEFESIIAPVDRCSLHLCGHQHENAIFDIYSGGSSQARRIVQARSLFGEECFGENEGIKRNFGFHGGKISFTEHGPQMRIWPRRLIEGQNGVWKFIPDHEMDITDDFGTEPVLLTSNSDAVVVKVKEEKSIVQKNNTKESRISEIVKKNIYNVLSSRHMADFIEEFIKQVELGNFPGLTSGTMESITDYLSGQVEIIIGLSIINLTLKKLREELLELENNYKTYTGIWHGAVNLIGWLVLLSVDDEWIAKNLDSSKLKDSGITFEIPVETEMGVEIVYSHREKRSAKLSADQQKLQVFGTNGITSDEFKIEPGFTCDDIVNLIKEQIFAAIHKRSNIQYTKEWDKDLNAAIEGRKLEHEHCYIVIKSDADTLNDANVLRQLTTDLPALDIFLMTIKDAGSAFVLPEISLMTKIRDFFKNAPYSE